MSSMPVTSRIMALVSFAFVAAVAMGVLGP